MNDLIQRLKDKNSTIPGTIFSVLGLIALFKDTAIQIKDAVIGLGYSWDPNPTTIALVLIIGIGLKMVFLDGKKGA